MWKAINEGGGMRAWAIVRNNAEGKAEALLDKSGKERRWGDGAKAKAYAAKLNAVKPGSSIA
jgi:hypothetical protein